MKPIVVVFVPTGRTAESRESYALAVSCEQARAPLSIIDTVVQPDLDGRPPFWTWFIENPRPGSRSLPRLKD